MEYTVLESVLPVTNDEYRRNLLTNLERGFPKCQPLPERENNRLAIVGSGPSVRDYLDEIRKFDGQIWAINGAYDFLQEHGIVADGFLGCDPLPGLCDYLKRPQRKTTFYIAGTCDPTTFDPVKDYDVQMWFLDAGKALDYPKDIGIWTVTGGTTCVLRAPFLAWMLGFRNLTFFGIDSSFDQDGRYCYRDGIYQWDSQAPVNWVRTEMNGKPFPTEMCLMKQVSQFASMLLYYKGKITVRCGGLMEAFLRAPTYDDSFLSNDAA